MCFNLKSLYVNFYIWVICGFASINLKWLLPSLVSLLIIFNCMVDIVFKRPIETRINLFSPERDCSFLCQLSREGMISLIQSGAELGLRWYCTFIKFSSPLVPNVLRAISVMCNTSISLQWNFGICVPLGLQDIFLCFLAQHRASWTTMNLWERINGSWTELVLHLGLL